MLSAARREGPLRLPLRRGLELREHALAVRGEVALRDLLGRHCEGSGKLHRARSRLYRGQNLQENMRLKALAEIYTMHSFALL